MCKDVQGKWLPKIADFGLSKHLDDNQDMSSQLLGTVEFMAPEQFNPVKFGVERQIQPNVDIWSLGVMIFKVYTGSFPFGAKAEGQSRDQIMRAILSKEPDEAKLAEVPEPMQTVIRRCLVKHAKDRAQQSRDLLDVLKGGNIGMLQALPTDLSIPRAEKPVVNTPPPPRRPATPTPSYEPATQKPPQRKSPKARVKEAKESKVEKSKATAPFVARFFLFLLPWAVLILLSAVQPGSILGVIGLGVVILGQGLMYALIKNGQDPEGKIGRILRPCAWGTLSIIIVFAGLAVFWGISDML
ncbi:MAG: protein kinase, partial [Bacteroidota bacterium]